MMPTLDVFVNRAGRSSARNSVVDYLSLMGVACPETELQIIVGEIIQNVLRHAYGEMGGTLTVEVEKEGSDRIVKMRDYGVGFKPIDLDLSEPDFSNEGGNGLRMMAQTVSPENFFLYSDHGFGTTIVMKFVA